ncbi:MAG: response regulator [Acidobacteriia bacterium]|nr:response regulator [Terriglobia bacterium]
MAKILVADDNSNIQKMVGLALKDQGIDVVAVGNGEAAVRKISELHPDLVLADVFMPVRNGYEVCEYVKTDTALAHTPVILLVGAFDPLDEQEAQRVGADGVLKKPFVPPEPLISMVKSALARALAAAAAAPPAAAPAPAAAASAVPAAAPEELPDIFSLQPASVTVPEGSEALAFGNLLETETPAAAEAALPPEPEHAWGSAPAASTATEEVAEEAAPELHWQSQSPEETVDGLPPAGAKDWRDSDLAAVPETSGAEQPAAAEHAEPASAYAATGIEEEASAVPEVSSHAWTEAAPAAEETLTPPWERSAATSSPAYEEPAPAEEIAAPANAWDTEVPKAGRLAATWDSAQAKTPAAEAETEAAAENEEPVAQHDFYVPVASSEELLLARQEEQPVAFAEEVPAPEIYHGVAAAEEVPSPAAAEEAEVAAVEPEPAAMEFAGSPAFSRLVSEAVPSMPAGAHAAAASELDMDAMVAKVLEKMSPEVIQAVTRELVKPMIEAILRGELDKQK